MPLMRLVLGLDDDDPGACVSLYRTWTWILRGEDIYIYMLVCGREGDVCLDMNFDY